MHAGSQQHGWAAACNLRYLKRVPQCTLNFGWLPWYLDLRSQRSDVTRPVACFVFAWFRRTSLC
jgi:hypothetical protein